MSSPPQANVILLNSTNPAAPAGKRNAKPQGGTVINTNVLINNVSTPVTEQPVTLYGPNLGSVDARTTTTETIGEASSGDLVTLSNGSAIAVTLNTTGMDSIFMCWVMCIGIGAATLTPSSGLINGAANVPLASGQFCALFFDGTNFRALIGSLTVNFADNETPSGTIDGSNKSFTVAHTPNPAASLVLVQRFSGGGSATLIQGTDYTLSGASITTTVPPATNDSLAAWYRF